MFKQLMLPCCSEIVAVDVTAAAAAAAAAAGPWQLVAC
jgi:hypothetical protein